MLICVKLANSLFRRFRKSHNAFHGFIPGYHRGVFHTKLNIRDQGAVRQDSDERNTSDSLQFEVTFASSVYHTSTLQFEVTLSSSVYHTSTLQFEVTFASSVYHTSTLQFEVTLSFSVYHMSTLQFIIIYIIDMLLINFKTIYIYKLFRLSCVILFS